MCKEKRIVYLAGIGMGTKEGMTVQAKESLKGCDCMIGAKLPSGRGIRCRLCLPCRISAGKNRRVPSKASAVLQDRDCTFRGCRILQRGKKTGRSSKWQ